MERALIEYELNNWDEVVEYTNKALKIEKSTKSYINEVFSWNHTPYDLLSLAYYYKGNYNKSLENINKALELSPYDERLLNNKKLIEEKLKQNTK